MTVRLFSAATALLAGLLAVLLLDLALGSPGALAQERKNCPPGFVWVRWSPNGCSQEKLPPHGYIDYDGWGTCEAGYQADIEQRATTDGQPPDGSPRTSFPYLKACVSITTGIGGGDFGGTAGDAAETLYDGGGGPSNEELAAVGVGLGLGFGVATWGTFVLGAGVGGPALPISRDRTRTLTRQIPSREELRYRIDMARGKEASMLRWFRKLDDKYNFLELQRFSIDADLQKLYDFLTRVNAKIGRSTPMQVGLFLLAVLLGIAVPGGWGVALGACPGVTGLAITVGTDDLQNLRVATRVRIEQWEQKLRQVNDELQKVKPYREAAMQHVKQTRGELDALESTWKTHYGDLWYQRTRPELPGERPFWDF